MQIIEPIKFEPVTLARLVQRHSIILG